MKDSAGREDEAIHLAASKGDLVGIQTILQEDPSKLTASGWMGAKPLHYAAHSGSLECVEFLLNMGAPVNELAEHSKTTAIFEASTAAIAKLLIEKGANLNLVSALGRVPLDYAIQGAHDEVVEVLIASGVDVNYDKGPDCFSTMLQWGIEPVGRSEEGKEAVRERIILMLLEAGAKPNQSNVYGSNAIHRACYFGQIGMVKMLLEHGANPNLRTESGRTAFDEAKDNMEILQILEPYRNEIPLPPKVKCSPEELVERIKKADGGNDDDYTGCTVKEITFIEKEHGVILPKSYKSFLKLLGKETGEFLVRDHSHASFEDLAKLGTKTDFTDFPYGGHDLLQELPAKAFVFLERLGAFYLFFVADGSSEDPPIYVIREDDEIFEGYDGLWDFIQECVEDFEFFRDPEKFSQ